MKTPESYFDEIFDFKGSWDMPSKCGLRRFESEGRRPVVIVTELYQDNPGSSITSVAASLAGQLAESFHYRPDELIYIECNPDMKSKLSFYDEEFFIVEFDYLDGQLVHPVWNKISKEKLIEITTI